ncbi:ABC transporter substrate-binding protein [Nocardioides sp. Leaf285]|uniref:ABC transporter substrate-binding protein n=1 Tax=Nocardioides sp. Leaf285 TaxID=1736322 RepID=UPI0007037D35|nr:ABC transporter substrate-binding protein [Nocardioides sp. Leaf285]KQP66286.1 ABC transporter substrate-binding protein [Nocardioides sp. Leaf285]
MPRSRRPVLTASALTAALALAGCGTATDTSGAAGGEPVTVTNCGSEVVLPAAPERVVMLKSAAVPYLHDLGVLDRVVARAGLYPAEYYDEQTLAELDAIPELTSDTDAGGHLQISKEVVVAQRPDLVLGEVDTLSRSGLEAVDVPLLEEPALCGTSTGETGFDDVWSQLALYGEVFDRPDEAAAATADLQERLAAVEAEVDGPSGRTAAVLYPTVGGGTTYAYGTGSMAHPQLEAAGLENVFGDVDERVVEVTLEELLGRDPDVIVLLHTDGDPAEVEEALVGLPGAERLTAVREGEVMTQLFNFTEPPSPLAVDGLEAIVARFGE